MAAGQFTFYQANLDDLRVQDLLAATVKVALVAASYTPNSGTGGHDEWADVSANEIAAGNGYAAGGYALTADAATAITGGWKYASENVAWTASGGSIPQWRYAVFYVSGSLWGKTSPLIGRFVGDSAPADIPATPSGEALTLTCPANGWFSVVSSP